MRKIILNLAMSLDGFISDTEGGFDWIVGHSDSGQDLGEGFDFNEFLSTVDTVVMGSKAYEDCILSGLTEFKDQEILVATTRNFEKRDHVKFIRGDIVGIIEDLRKDKGKDIFLFGGAGVTDTFIKADVIDQYVIGIIPTILGQGRLLFKGGYPKIDLHLDELSVSDGVTVMVYSKRKH